MGIHGLFFKPVSNVRLVLEMRATDALPAGKLWNLHHNYGLLPIEMKRLCQTTAGWMVIKTGPWGK